MLWKKSRIDKAKGISNRIGENVTGDLIKLDIITKISGTRIKRYANKREPIRLKNGSGKPLTNSMHWSSNDLMLKIRKVCIKMLVSIPNIINLTSMVVPVLITPNKTITENILVITKQTSCSCKANIT